MHHFLEFSDDLMRSEFLQFATCRRYVERKMKIQIQQNMLVSIDALPTAKTCVHTLYLSHYSSYEKFVELMVISLGHKIFDDL
jgi:hypothetical protein